jgi:hypothetical protein
VKVQRLIKKYQSQRRHVSVSWTGKVFSDDCKARLRGTLAALDPVRLQSEIREHPNSPINPELSGFVAGLSMAWRNDEARPTHHRRTTGPRTYRARVDPFETVWPQVQQWLDEQHDVNAKDLFLRLHESVPAAFPWPTANSSTKS